LALVQKDRKDLKAYKDREDPLVQKVPLVPKGQQDLKAFKDREDPLVPKVHKDLRLIRMRCFPLSTLIRLRML
jgi:hypothetical protein